MNQAKLTDKYVPPKSIEQVNHDQALGTRSMSGLQFSILDEVPQNKAASHTKTAYSNQMTNYQKLLKDPTIKSNMRNKMAI